MAIIGAGWFGCHIGLKLKKRNFIIKIFEKGNDIFYNTSGNKTNRLHLGFHYPRSIKTREMSFEGFKRFIKEYPKLSLELNENIYAIANDKANKISPITFKKSMNKSKLKFNEYNISQTDLKNVLKTFNTKERQIDHLRAKKFFLRGLKKKLIFKL